MTLTETSISIESTNGVAWLRFNRPDTLNAVSTAALAELAEALESARDADAVVITGAGRAFCTGADLGTDVNGATVAAAGEVVSLIAAMPAPVIAAVNGPAAGVGASIAFACDLVLAADSAFFLLPFLPLGLVPDGGATHAVVTGAGRTRAARMAFGGERIPAALAAEWGLVGEVVPAAELEARIGEVVSRLCSAPRAAVTETKRLLRAAEAPALAAALQRELEIQSDLLGRQEYARAREGFLARKPVDFRGERG
ncbi:enoyl-CoA hydratase-related protein [Arthrobacter sp. zg-Y1219]|uniref:enoyl-CoA hydratase-related protein n=1 Tax=Arthrobacter sp. zg-Y1219 TaxID=3049067 RepID=UPI0024C292BF|nr:enoyl-CoA hydratase-related protein [Arthrobacter sp. zg-Y1219]MDK1358700.1 enoyl-CoA hydratase-related protein [Arthrobacter sp. zg-Y1219]